MKRGVCRLAALLLTAVMLQGSLFSSSAMTESLMQPSERETSVSVSDVGAEEGSLHLNCKSAVLMEATTGTILYTQNANEALPPASVTKIMTLLLVMEALDAGTVHPEDLVTASANAASMGGSQIFLKEGEQMRLEDLLKSVVIASANDAAVALAEHLAGSVGAFVDQMNAEAAKLGMKDTVFENVTGLDDTAEHHLTSAYDIGLMSRALIAHPTVLRYSSVWMDSIRDGAFGLTNTNRLVRFYNGCTGLKTGSTSKAGFCVSATAERDGLSLICVIMGAESRDLRNALATQLLDWGFAGYGLYRFAEGETEPIPVTGGMQETCATQYSAFTKVLPKRDVSAVQVRTNLPETVAAPVKVGDTVGTIDFLSGGVCIGSVPIVAAESVDKINFFELFRRILAKFLLI